MSRGPYGASEERLREGFHAGEYPIAVYGLGKMGLPLAAVFAEATGAVTGVDVDPSVVETVATGDCHVTAEPGLADLVAGQVEGGRLTATTDGERAAREATVHVVIVPTLVSGGEPDLSTVEAVLDVVAAGLSPGDLVIAESTLPPGTCRDAIVPHLAAGSGLEPAEFGVAACPERTASGTALRDIRGAYPKVVGGVDEVSARAASALYREVSNNEIHVVGDAATAEAVKVFEGVYRDANIALANELGLLGDELGISAREAIAAANAIPMCDLHDPGPGVGGHCIPNYPYFLLAGSETPLEVIRTARTRNETMPAATADAFADELAAAGEEVAGASVLVLGLTYRPGVAETRRSPALGVIDRLEELGADVAACDPLVDPGEFGVRPVAVGEIPDQEFDGAILVTPQTEFETIEWKRIDPMVVVDGRDALDLTGTDHRCRTLAGSVGDRPRVVSRAEREAPDYLPDQ
ncbi:nucleotide sugar dehydrogenase [Saliphagus infecundisoli]|uniref:UDP-N-acetyl-D-mannosamine dehydrogenase n=1 Tax=Saliphagus infecundisoli TaxID=1849069 RepID=A0ABD5QIP1_9EURY|nr:nucleotide sugar dehydrogenase [Saliphagus infecundisoli]